MMMRCGGLLLACLALAGCEPGPISDLGPTDPLPDLPDEVIAAADPRFVVTARLRPDGCYWYVHSNVVETTFLPLRTVDGRRICAFSEAERAARAEAAAQAAAGAAL